MFTACVKEHASYADQQWDADYSHLMAQSTWSPGPGGGKGMGASPRKPKQKGLGKGTKNKKGGQHDGKGQSAAKKMQTVRVWVGAKHLQVAENKGDKKYCVDFNTGNCSKTDCPDIHRCNIVTGNGKVCGNTHPAKKHKGNTKG